MGWASNYKGARQRLCQQWKQSNGICHFTSTYNAKQLNPWPNSLASHVLNYSRLSACQGKMESSKDHLSTCEHLTSLRNKRSLGNFQCQYLAKLLVNVYSHHLMMKCVCCCYVRGSRLFSNLVTYHKHGNIC